MFFINISLSLPCSSSPCNINYFKKHFGILNRTICPVFKRECVCLKVYISRSTIPRMALSVFAVLSILLKLATPGGWIDEYLHCALCFSSVCSISSLLHSDIYCQLFSPFSSLFLPCSITTGAQLLIEFEAHVLNLWLSKVLRFLLEYMLLFFKVAVSG